MPRAAPVAKADSLAQSCPEQKELNALYQPTDQYIQFRSGQHKLPDGSCLTGGAALTDLHEYRYPLANPTTSQIYGSGDTVTLFPGSLSR
jgi:hypothetical protein